MGDKCRRQAGNKCKIMRPRATRTGDKCGRQAGDKCKIMRPRAPRVGDRWEGPAHPEWETSVGDKWTSVGDKWGTSGKTCGPERPEWNASSETKAKSCGPGMQPFQRIKNPIQVPVWGITPRNKNAIYQPQLFSCATCRCKGKRRFGSNRPVAQTPFSSSLPNWVDGSK